MKTKTIIVENNTYITLVLVTESWASEKSQEEIEIIKNTNAFKIPVLIMREIGFLSFGFINSETYCTQAKTASKISNSLITRNKNVLLSGKIILYIKRRTEIKIAFSSFFPLVTFRIFDFNSPYPLSIK